MQIAIIGGGKVGRALGSRWAAQGHSIIYGVRDPESPKVAELVSATGPNTAAKTVQAAAQAAEVVVLATSWSGTQDAVNAAGDLNGKVLIDCTNPLKPNLAGLATEGETSAAEQIAGWAKNARVVKAFNTTGSKNMEDPVYPSGALSMFICGDDAEAKRTAAQLAAELGFEPVDTGGLTMARYLEPLAMLWVSLAYSSGYGPDFGFKLVKRSQ